MFGGNFAPAGWAFCSGQLLSISEYETLFQLIGTTYGGDGQSTYAMPDLRGRIPVHMGTHSSGLTYQIGEMAGQETVTLTSAQMPAHNHALLAASSPGYLASPEGGVPAKHRDYQAFTAGAPGLPQMHASSLGTAGGSQPHDNMPPYLGLSFIISLFGIFPSPT